MKLLEIKGNIFEVKGNPYFAHCIAADYRMGAGIAVQFQKKFHLRDALQCVKVNGPDCILVNRVFNLVTKKKSNGKPTPASIRLALHKMAQLLALMSSEKPIKVAMPRIGCGLDRQSWAVIREIIKEEFDSLNVIVEVYKL